MAPELAEPEIGVRVLIVGYGNTLRGDDGLGAYVVEQLARRRLCGVTVRTACQLTPELSEELANVDAAIFVDACTASSGGVSVRAVEPRPSTGGFTHIVGVDALLDLTSRLYRRVPRAWIVSVAGTDFALHEGLSAHARANAYLALRQIEELIGANTTRKPS